jgi:hypothetical protein
MHLYELTSLDLTGSGPSVPGWTLGCFRRRSITFFTGAEDVTTEVVWLQSRGLTADFRRPRGTPRRARAVPIADIPLDELLGLARVEAGLGHTRYDGEVMRWSDWTSFQTHPRWPEPGRLSRVGNCLMELAPSGAYVEDWRLQPSGDGPLIGLRLLDERDARTGVVRHRGGGLVVCGQHAAFVRGRPEPLPEGCRLEDFVREHAAEPRELTRAFAFDAAYGTSPTPGADITVTLATLPWREGQALLSLEGFAVERERGLVVQRIEEAGVLLERRFSIDTLERRFSGPAATDASRDGVRWLEQEADLLHATLR